ncbi:MAG: hypothetical protein U5L45_23315 [Saprospiraceae bacterium]|nr:hypothetical protein [Saprospiraceae bacterium]
MASQALNVLAVKVLGSSSLGLQRSKLLVSPCMAAVVFANRRRAFWSLLK